MDSNVGLAIQCVGVLLITLLSIFMRSSIKSNALTYWTASWASLSLSLVSLLLGFQLDSNQTSSYSCYFFGEYSSAAVHRRLSQPGERRTSQKDSYFLYPALLSLVLPYARATSTICS
jgi:hypothetical protein